MAARNATDVTIQLRRDTASNWTAENPVLAAGEIGIETDTLRAKVGDGATAWNSLSYAFGITNYVTTDTDQDITGVKTFIGTKTIRFKQAGTNDKLGFTLYTNNDVEKGYLEFNPTNKIDNAPLLTLGNYATSAAGITQVGFRRYSTVSGANGAYNLLTPLIADAKTPFNLTTTYTNFYLPLGVTDGTTMVRTDKRGVLDISSLLASLESRIAALEARL
jgi:hypothetical protein